LKSSRKWGQEVPRLTYEPNSMEAKIQLPKKENADKEPRQN